MGRGPTGRLTRAALLGAAVSAWAVLPVAADVTPTPGSGLTGHEGHDMGGHAEPTPAPTTSRAATPRASAPRPVSATAAPSSATSHDDHGDHATPSVAVSAQTQHGGDHAEEHDSEHVDGHDESPSVVSDEHGDDSHGDTGDGDGHGDDHGTTDTGPRPVGAVMAGFTGINAAILAAAAILRRRHGRRS